MYLRLLGLLLSFSSSLAAQNIVFLNKLYKVYPYRMVHGDIEPFTLLNAKDDLTEYFNIPIYTKNLEDGDYLVLFDTIFYASKYLDKHYKTHRYFKNPAATLHIERGQKNGPVMFYSYPYTQDTQKIATVLGNYKNDLKDGTWTYFYLNKYAVNTDTFTATFKDGALTGPWDYRGISDIHKHGNYVNGLYSGKQYNLVEVGQELLFENGRMAGKYEYLLLDSSGNEFLCIGELKDGKLDSIVIKNKQGYALYSLAKNTFENSSENSKFYSPEVFNLLTHILPVFEQARNKIDFLGHNFSLHIYSATEPTQTFIGDNYGVIPRPIDISYKTYKKEWIYNKKQKLKQILVADSAAHRFTLSVVDSTEYMGNIYKVCHYVNKTLVDETQFFVRKKIFDYSQIYELNSYHLLNTSTNLIGYREFTKELIEESKNNNLGRWTYSLLWYKWKNGVIPNPYLRDSTAYMNEESRTVKRYGRLTYVGTENDVHIYNGNLYNQFNGQFESKNNEIVGYNTTNTIRRDSLNFSVEIQHPFTLRKSFSLSWDSLEIISEQPAFESEYNASFNYIWEADAALPLHAKQLKVNGKYFTGDIIVARTLMNYWSQNNAPYETNSTTSLSDYNYINDKNGVSGKIIQIEFYSKDTNQRRMHPKRRKHQIEFIDTTTKVFSYKNGYLLEARIYDKGFSEYKELAHYALGELHGSYMDRNVTTNFNRGKLHGIAVTFMGDVSGSRAICEFINGKLNGNFLAFSPGLEPSVSARFRNDTACGTWIFYNGQAISDSFSFDATGFIDGKYVHYSQSSMQPDSNYAPILMPDLILYFDHGKPIKQGKIYNSKGSLTETIDFDSSATDSITVWDSQWHNLIPSVQASSDWMIYPFYIQEYEERNKLLIGGSLQLHYNTQNWNGYHTYFYQNGIKSAEGAILNEMRNGWWTYYNEAGKVYKKIFYTLGEWSDSLPNKPRRISQGTAIAYDRNGIKLYEGYIMDEDFTSVCATTVNLTQDDIYYTAIYDSIGNNIIKLEQSIPVVEYNMEGNIMYRGWWKNNMRDSIWQFYTLNGSLTKIGKYQRGKKQGRWLSGSLSGFNYNDNVCFDEKDTLAIFNLRKQLEFIEVVWLNGVAISSIKTQITPSDRNPNIWTLHNPPMLFFKKINKCWSRKKKNFMMKYDFEKSNNRHAPVDFRVIH